MMEQVDAELHPIYGAIPADGDFVQQGDILGFSVDARELVTAPVSGRVRLVTNRDSASTRLYVQIMAGRSEGVHLSSESAA